MALLEWPTDLNLFRAFSVVLVILVSALYFIPRLMSKRGTGRPPCNYGWLPFLGCAIEFGKEPLIYIRKMQRAMGSVFTLYIGGWRMTFLTEPEDFNKYFMQSEYVDFQQAIKLFVQSAASINDECLLKYHTGIHDMMKGKLAASQLPKFSGDLHNQLMRRFQELKPDGRFELNDLVRIVMYPAVIRNLFGEGLLPIDNETALRELTDKFVMFDAQFEYGTQIPAFILREWASCKHWLLRLFGEAMMKTKSGDTTLLKSLYDAVEGDHAANYGLLMLWASLANAIPITFWTLVYIAANPLVRKKVLQELKDAQTSGGELKFDSSTQDKLTYIKCCILETIRIRSPGIITRRVVKPFTVKGYNIPAGDLIFISPYWSHRNEEYFPDPEQFNPDRFSGHDFSKSTFPPGFVAFGGGRYMCPGRWYALMELVMVIGLFFHQFDITLDSAVPQPDVMHLVGVQQPQTKCYVNIRPRV